MVRFARSPSWGPPASAPPFAVPGPSLALAPPAPEDSAPLPLPGTVAFVEGAGRGGLCEQPARPSAAARIKTDRALRIHTLRLSGAFLSQILTGAETDPRPDPARLPA